jgi:hypothetical protein
MAPAGELSQGWLIAGVRDGQMQESVPNALSPQDSAMNRSSRLRKSRRALHASVRACD